jgi:hypothetical protein
MQDTDLSFSPAPPTASSNVEIGSSSSSSSAQLSTEMAFAIVDDIALQENNRKNR